MAIEVKCTSWLIYATQNHSPCIEIKIKYLLPFEMYDTTRNYCLDLVLAMFLIKQQLLKDKCSLI